MSLPKGTFARCNRTGDRFVVISGSMFNDVAAYPHVMVMEVHDATEDEWTYPYFVAVERDGRQLWIRITSITEYPKTRLEPDATIAPFSSTARSKRSNRENTVCRSGSSRPETRTSLRPDLRARRQPISGRVVPTRRDAWRS